MNFLVKYRSLLLGIGLGTIAGFSYYYFVGCASGSCAITSNPVVSSLYGALLGGLTVNAFQKEKSKSS